MPTYRHEPWHSAVSGRLLSVNVGRPRQLTWQGDDFTYGQFGENLTVEGLADDEVCIGDRYRIGGALLEVTQPRVTCYRVGIRMGDPAMPSLLVAHHRPGFYFRVLEEGAVQAGDAIVKVADGPERLTVAQVDALLYLPGKSRALLERALRVRALSDGWKGSFRELLARPVQDMPAWPGFQPLRFAEIRRESATVASFRLEPLDAAGPSPRAAAGQYLTLRLRPDADAPPLVRSYSLSAVPDEHGYRISVKREGAGSRYLHEHVMAGDIVDVAAPRGGFVLREGTRPVVLISAGVGATPVLAMLHALAAEQTPRPVWWLHGARNRGEHAFGAEADALLATLPDARRVVAYSRPGVGEEPGPDYDVALERVATEAFGAIPVSASGIVKAGDRAPHAPDGPPGDGPTVTFVRSNLAMPWDDRYGSLLDFAEACDVPVSFGCRNGVCHNCESGLLSGSVAYDPDPLEPPPAGRVLVCCSLPCSEVTLDL